MVLSFSLGRSSGFFLFPCLFCTFEGIVPERWIAWVPIHFPFFPRFMGLLMKRPQTLFLTTRRLRDPTSPLLL